MVNEEPVGGVDATGFPVVDRDPVGVGFPQLGGAPGALDGCKPRLSIGLMAGSIDLTVRPGHRTTQKNAFAAPKLTVSLSDSELDKKSSSKNRTELAIRMGIAGRSLNGELSRLAGRGHQARRRYENQYISAK